MTSLTITGHIDAQHRLTADVPDSIPPGPVTVRITPVSNEDEAGDAWMAGIAREWAGDWNDSLENSYSLTDGEPIRDD